MMTILPVARASHLWQGCNFPFKKSDNGMPFPRFPGVFPFSDYHAFPDGVKGWGLIICLSLTIPDQPLNKVSGQVH
jgi:hypothetical protein